MPFGRFSVATISGAGLWCTILSLYGAQVITPELMAANDTEALVKAVKAKLGLIVAGIVVLALAYVVMLFLRSKAESEKPAAKEAKG